MYKENVLSGSNILIRRLVMILLLLLVYSYQTYAQTSTILVDFGNNPSPSPWINLSNPKNGIVTNLTNSLGVATNITLEIFDAFNNINTNGTQNPDPALNIPGTASGDSFYGNTVLWQNLVEPTAGIRLSNLDTEKEYTLTLFASRMAGDNRETQYICTGSEKDTSYLNVADNISKVVTFSDYPTSEGTIEIMASPGPNNNNSYRFYYLGALLVEYESEFTPEPELFVIRPNGGEFWQVGKEVKIQWQNTTMSQASLEYSTDDGANWTSIATAPPYQKSYDWIIPNTPSTQCLVRVSADTLSDRSDNTFEISIESGSCSIVVLGSSTAEGIGASSPDSTWVNRFRNAVFLNDTRNEVINLAKGGYTTYHLLPTGSTAGSTVGISVDRERNITKALSLNPAAIIINLPSNDAANYFPVEDQLANFDAMVSTANDQFVPVWICTTQPRNFSSSTQLQIQKDARDSIFAVYGDYAIDFWNGLAEPNGFILDMYDSGDGIHLNDKGHRLLFERVMEKMDVKNMCNAIKLIDMKSHRFLQGIELLTWESENDDGHVEIWYSRNAGQDWILVADNEANDGMYEWNTELVPDCAFGLIKLFLKNENDFIYAFVQSGFFTINNAQNGEPFLKVNKDPFKENTAVNTDKITLSVLIGDAENDPMNLDYYYSTDNGTTRVNFYSTVVFTDTVEQEFELFVRDLPNSNILSIHLQLSDEDYTVTDATPSFAKINSRAAQLIATQIAGNGSGKVYAQILDPSALTGDTYQVTFEHDERKTYDVINATRGEIIVEDATEIDGVSEGPFFDGIRLIIKDYDPAEFDSKNSRWLTGESTLKVNAYIRDYVIGTQTYPAYPYPADYSIVIYDQVVDTSSTAFGAPAREMYFTVTNVTHDRKADLIFIDSDRDKQISRLDYIYILEPDESNELQFTWTLYFGGDSTALPPKAGDEYMFRTLKPITTSDMFSFDAILTDVETSSAPNRNSVKLFQNYPNPFNPITKISFHLKNSSIVDLKVYNIRGQEVATLYNGFKPSGDHVLNWDATDFPSGLYFYCLQAGEFVRTRKLILLK